jgi:recombination protein RecA
MAKKTRKVRSVIPATPVDSPRLDALKIISGESKDVPVMSTVLKPIRYVPTIFSSFNRAIVLGGAPLRSTWLIHGPSASGKSAFALGLVNSFVQHGHAAAYIDAEHAVSKQWFNELGADMNAILFEQPNTFEEAIAQIDKWISNFKKAKTKGIIEPNKGFIIVVDTIHKLVPKRELEKITTPKGSQKKIEDNIDKGWGRFRANLISVWIDKMTPVVGKNDITLVMIAHERDNPDTMNWFSPDYKVKGGQTLIYESMVRTRVTAGEPIKIEIAGKKIIVGNTHNIAVAKNKVGYPHELAKIYTSNGKGEAPIGFDLEREVFNEGLLRGTIEQSGSWYYLPSGEKFQGDDQSITYLRDNPDAYQELFDSLLIKSQYECAQ